MIGLLGVGWLAGWLLEMGGRVAEKEKLFTGCDARSPLRSVNVWHKHLFEGNISCVAIFRANFRAYYVQCQLMLSCHGFPLFKIVFPLSDPAVVFLVSPHRSCRIQSEIWTKRILSPSSIHLIPRITSLVLFRATIDRISSDTNGWNENQEISFRRPELLVLPSRENC